MGDHPVIDNLIRTGSPDGKEAEYPRCPNCGEDAENFYRTKSGQVVGCERCLIQVPYYEMEQGGSYVH